MRALVVYESLWGNTATIARAIAEGVGPDARAISTAEATPETVAGCDLLVCGSPLLGFALPTPQMRESIRTNPANPRPNLTHPAMRTWLEKLPAQGAGKLSAGFETRIWWSPGSAAKSIMKALAEHGFRCVDKPGKFIVTGRYGPLKDGEIERARAWGAALARAAGA